MKKILFGLLAILLIASSCTTRHSITMTVPQWGNDTILIMLYTIDGSRRHPQIDTLIAHHGKICYDYNGQDTLVATIINQPSIINYGRGQVAGAESKSTKILIHGQSSVSIKGELTEKGLSCEVLDESGFATDFCKDMIEVQAQTLPYLVPKDSLFYIMIPLFNDESMQDSAMSIYNSIYELLSAAMNIQMGYVQNHPNSQLSAWYLCNNEEEDFDMETAFQQLSKEVQNGMFKQNLQNRLAIYQAYQAKELRKKEAGIVVGAVAPNFTLPNLRGKMVSLSSFRGKWVVLDFWGSWCPWCIRGIPKMKEAYAAYRPKMEIVSIDCRDTDAQWREAVAKYEMPWIHLYNGASAKVNVSSLYLIEGYPTKILLNPQGVIANISIGESEDFYRMLKETIK